MAHTTFTTGFMTHKDLKFKPQGLARPEVWGASTSTFCFKNNSDPLVEELGIGPHLLEFATPRWDDGQALLHIRNNENERVSFGWEWVDEASVSTPDDASHLPCFAWPDFWEANQPFRIVPKNFINQPEVEHHKDLQICEFVLPNLYTEGGCLIYFRDKKGIRHSIPWTEVEPVTRAEYRTTRLDDYGLVPIYAYKSFWEHQTHFVCVVDSILYEDYPPGTVCEIEKVEGIELKHQGEVHNFAMIIDVAGREFLWDSVLPVNYKG